MKKIIVKLRLGKIGLIELLVALFPILAAYRFGSFSLGWGTLLILDILTIPKMRKRGQFRFKLFYYFAAFICIHEILWLFVIPTVPSYYINTFLGYIIFIFSIIWLQPLLDEERLEGSINWVSIICFFGMLYHAYLLFSGSGEISPIPLPFLPEVQSEESRILNVLNRPTSFFVEPQSYVSYMLVPIFYAMWRKNFLIVILYSISMILSTSTTALIMIVLMPFVYALLQKVRLKTWGAFFLMVLIFGYVLLYSDLGEGALMKAADSEMSAAIRIMNGWLVAKTMSFGDLFLGVGYANVHDYVVGQGLTNIGVFFDNEGELFVSAIWISLIRYGVIGFLLFVSLYLKAIRINKNVSPYVICLVVSLFSNPDFIGSSFVFQFLVIITFIYYYPVQNEKSINSNHSVGK